MALGLGIGLSKIKAIASGLKVRFQGDGVVVAALDGILRDLSASFVSEGTVVAALETLKLLGVNFSGTGTMVAEFENFTEEYQAVLDYATAQGYTLPSEAQQVLQNQLVIDLISSNVWAKRDVIYNPANDGSAGFGSLNWKNPTLHQMTLVNSPTFTVNLGFSGNGTSSYVDLNYNPEADGVEFQLNDHGYECYNFNATANTGVLISAFGSNYCEISNDNPNSRFILFDSATVGRTVSVGVNSQDGWLMNERTGSLASDWKTYKNNVELTHIGQVVAALPNVNFRLFARNSGSFFGDGQAAFVGAGASLTTQEKTDYYTIVNNYLAAI